MKSCSLLAQLAIFATLASCQPTAAPTATPALAGDTVRTTVTASQVDKCNTPNEYDIPAGRFDETAQQLAHATGCFIEADLAAVGAVPVAAVRGRLTLREALVLATNGTRLVVASTQAGQLNVTLRQ